MDRDVIIRKSLRGGVIVFAAVGSQSVIAFATQVALARMLEPAHFGALAFATMVAMFFNNFTNVHGDKYIVKEKDNIHQKLDNAFTVELLLSIFFIGFVVSVAPFLMKLLGKPELTTFVQILSFIFLYNPLSKPRSLFERELSFFRAKFPMVVAQSIGSIIGISLAYANYGIWSLIWYRLTTPALEILIIWLIAPYRPRLEWNWDIIKDSLKFGTPLIGISILVFFYGNIDYFLVGQLLNKEQLGYYWLAFQFTLYPLKIKTAINSIVFPAVSRTGNKNDIEKGFGILTRLSAIIYMFPVILLLVMGDEIVSLIFGDKWLPATTAFQILIVVAALRGIIGNWDSIFLYYGKTKIMFYMSLFNSTSSVVLGYFATTYYGIKGMAFAILFSFILVNLPIGVTCIKKLINFSYIRIIIKPITASLCLLLLIKLLKIYTKEHFFYSHTIVTIIVFTAIYTAIMYYFFRHDIKLIMRNRAQGD